jgi:outer membrane protein TolC
MRRLQRTAPAALFALAATSGLLCGSAVQGAAPPATPGTLTLSDVVTEALRQRPLLAADAEKVAAATARITQARAPLLPRLDIQASATDGPLGAIPFK